MAACAAHLDSRLSDLPAAAATRVLRCVRHWQAVGVCLPLHVAALIAQVTAAASGDGLPADHVCKRVLPCLVWLHVESQHSVPRPALDAVLLRLRAAHADLSAELLAGSLRSVAKLQRSFEDAEARVKGWGSGSELMVG